MKLHRAPALHPFPLQAPKIHVSTQFPWPAALPFNPTRRKIWTFGLLGPFRETVTEPHWDGWTDGRTVGWKHRETARVLRACSSPSFYFF